MDIMRTRSARKMSASRAVLVCLTLVTALSSQWARADIWDDAKDLTHAQREACRRVEPWAKRLRIPDLATKQDRMQMAYAYILKKKDVARFDFGIIEKVTSKASRRQLAGVTGEAAAVEIENAAHRAAMKSMTNLGNRYAASDRLVSLTRFAPHDVAKIVTNQAYIEARIQAAAGAEEAFVTNYVRSLADHYPEVSREAAVIHARVANGSMTRAALAQQASRASVHLEVLEANVRVLNMEVGVLKVMSRELALAAAREPNPVTPFTWDAVKPSSSAVAEAGGAAEGTVGAVVEGGATRAAEAHPGVVLGELGAFPRRAGTITSAEARLLAARAGLLASEGEAFAGGLSGLGRYAPSAGRTASYWAEAASVSRTAPSMSKAMMGMSGLLKGAGAAVASVLAAFGVAARGSSEFEDVA